MIDKYLLYILLLGVIALVAGYFIGFFTYGVFVSGDIKAIDKNQCESGNPNYEWVTGCPDYECTCEMTRNQSLCKSVLEECRKQAQKLPREQICVTKLVGGG